MPVPLVRAIEVPNGQQYFSPSLLFAGGCPVWPLTARSPSLPFHSLRVAWLLLDCARRTSTFLSCAFREQRRPSSLPSSHTPSTLACFSQEGGLFGLPLRATFSPAHPLARRDVPFTRRAPSERARSASKKGIWLPPSYSSFDRATPSWL